MKNGTLVDRVATTIEKWRMLPAGDSLLVGVSGGADSVCLVHVLTELGFKPGLAHVNHGWRGQESDQDAWFVEDLARKHNLEFFEHRSQTGAGQGNLEAAARKTRHQFFQETVKRDGFARIALGHTADDRVETFLHHLLRGSGTRGLVSMRPVSGNIVRPLIRSTRGEIEDYLKEKNQAWREDRSNEDIRFVRNRIRHVVLPELTAAFNPRLRDSLSRTIDILEAEDDWLEDMAHEWLESRASGEGRALVVDFEGLGSKPIAFVRRVLRASLERAGSSMQDIGFDHVENMRSLLEFGKSGRVIELPGPIVVERNFEQLVFRPADSVHEDYEYELTIPGEVHVPQIDTIFQAHLCSPDAFKPKKGRAFVDGESLGPCVKIRNWKNGDFYNPIGRRASKLKELFQAERIPQRKRRQWPIFVAESSIVWVASFPVSRDFVPTGTSRRIVEFEAVPSAKVI
jgi:tRNA(Ile)-lysidine synthase